MGYQIIVGNIGTVLDTNDHRLAVVTFHDYVRQANAGYGRASGESVVFMRDGEIVSERLSDVDRYGEDFTEAQKAKVVAAFKPYFPEEA
jgi:argonaute-like protein implicated in RNA metabolism and viral defense